MKKFLILAVILALVLVGCEHESSKGDDNSFKVQPGGIGSTGPGGGIIFFAEGNQRMECSGELGNTIWPSAVEAAKNHKGGGFTNWRLPNRAELDLMYKNLKQNGLGGFSNGLYWTSIQDSYNPGGYAYTQNFNNGNQESFSKSRSYGVRAVRSYSINTEPDPDPASLKIGNHSGYTLLNARYSSVNFGNIGIGENKVMNVPENSSNHLYFSLSINNIPVQCRTNAIRICETGKTEEWSIYPGDIITAIESGITGTFQSVYEALSKPIFELSQNDIVIENNNPLPFDFESVELGANKQLLFVIKNTGNLSLELTGDPVIISSNDVFTVPSQPTNKTINPGASIAFLLQYTPTEEKEDTATITIFNNGDELVFTLNVKGESYEKKPQIFIQQDTTTINPHGEFNFGNTAIDELKELTFTIGNAGEANLNFILVNDKRVNIENNTGDYFTVVQPATGVVIPDSTTTFIIRFNPVTEGSNFLATITIKTNSQNDDEFSFAVRGNGYIKRPQITVSQSASVINPHGEYDFRNVAIGESKEIVFTVGNLGEADLNFITVDDNRVNLANNTGSYFTITQPTTSTVTPGNTTTFSIIFNPTVEGSNFTANVLIQTNSQNNDEFLFAVRGSGYIKRPQISIRQDNSRINSHGEYDLGYTRIDTNRDITFTIRNTGEADLTFVTVNDNRINLEDNTAEVFTVIQQPFEHTIVNPGNTTTFVIRFNPQTAGSYVASVHIKTNSQHDDDFSFWIKGNGANTYQIGDIGPGGGIVFFAEGSQYKEVSGELGATSWSQALTTAGNYRGGGFTNWVLSTRSDLNLLQQNLHNKNLGGFSTGSSNRYWSSEESSFYSAWYFYFNTTNGYWNTADKSSILRVRAVRSFAVQ